jgi:sulfite exporter TauE/SafE
MTLLMTMLPFYLIGNFHCLGMCGPLTMMLSAHRYRFFYFAGRLVSFTLAGTIAGEIGAVLSLFFQYYHISAVVSLIFGSIILLTGAYGLLGRSYPGQQILAKFTAKANGSIALLMLRDRPLATFLFGFLTLMLPCGQSLVVFSTCALSGSLWIGMLNGFAFALLTSPSLFLAMQAHTMLGKSKGFYQTAGHFFALIVGVIALCRGFAEFNWLPHMTVSLPFSESAHFVLF